MHLNAQAAMPETHALAALSARARQILSRYQHGFPVAAEPWQVVADELGCSYAEVRAARQEIEHSGLVSRLGAVVRPGAVGASTLAAMRVPPQRLDAVAGVVNSYREVNHNYAREDEWNLWFVVTAPDEERLQSVLHEVAQRAQCPLLDCRLQKPYHIDLGFPL